MAKNQTRRSISVRGELYDRIHEYCETNNVSMSSFVENRISSFLNGSLMDEQPPLPYVEEYEPFSAGEAPSHPTTTQANRPVLSHSEMASEIQQHFTF
ncbi:hypothetical protein KKD52_01290 [Myxococcota bacterium]|jgi:hypothetical protein|nr:hypothetical protein [Myxococcota bacterium]MBU1242255.1 hypothetical protein [Myxococcota bacterium]MBU1508965.1 hypothetical protein [Myxococcota bacterium]PKN21680.1 MAG: hypothetical protein CVU65_16395 [Deltaproteobacteria bacterium HGW-Deltaproteobacteria-22]